MSESVHGGHAGHVASLTSPYSGFLKRQAEQHHCYTRAQRSRLRRPFFHELETRSAVSVSRACIIVSRRIIDASSWTTSKELTKTALISADQLEDNFEDPKGGLHRPDSCSEYCLSWKGRDRGREAGAEYLILTP